MRALALVVLAACGGSSSHASAPATLDCQPSTETGSLRGSVTDAKTHAPIQTSLMLKSACSRAGSQPRYAITDDRGAYFFADMPVDTYDVFVAGAARVSPARIRIDGGAEMHVNVDVTR